MSNLEQLFSRKEIYDNLYDAIEKLHQTQDVLALEMTNQNAGYSKKSMLMMQRIRKVEDAVFLLDYDENGVHYQGRKVRARK